MSPGTVEKSRRVVRFASDRLAKIIAGSLPLFLLEENLPAIEVDLAHTSFPPQNSRVILQRLIPFAFALVSPAAPPVGVDAWIAQTNRLRVIADGLIVFELLVLQPRPSVIGRRLLRREKMHLQSATQQRESAVKIFFFECFLGVFQCERRAPLPFEKENSQSNEARKNQRQDNSQ